MSLIFPLESSVRLQISTQHKLLVKMLISEAGLFAFLSENIFVLLRTELPECDGLSPAQHEILVPPLIDIRKYHFSVCFIEK